MNRQELNKNVEESAMKAILADLENKDKTDSIMEGFIEVMEHQFTITDDEIDIIKNGLKLLHLVINRDDAFTQENYKNLVHNATAMIEEIIVLVENQCKEV